MNPARLEAIFRELYGPGEVRMFFAPGRVNLIGEHTDYTGGYVFPASLTFGTWAVVRPRGDGRFRLASTKFAERSEFTTEEMDYRKEDGWANYPKGVICQFLQQGVELSGYDMLFHGDVPLGAGLSSSASIEMATAKALSAAENLPWSTVDLVRLAQRAENEFIGVQCGVMDPFASGMGKAGHAILLKCDTLDYRYVPLTLDDYRLVIIHTNITRGLAHSRYNERRRECEEGFRQLQNQIKGVRVLGDVKPEDWKRVGSTLTPERLRRRIRHVVTENHRVLSSFRALETGNLHRFGQLMRESHLSLREDFEVTGPELDALYEEAVNVEGCIGARMTGAGFGGCTVNLVHKDALGMFENRVKEGYRRRTGRMPVVYHAGIGEGAREIYGEAGSCPYS